jgi:hypothetical protein
MSTKLLTVVLPVFLPLAIFAQKKIETDRPTETQNAGLVPKGTFQAEIGFRKEHENGQQNNYMYPNAVFRYGLFKQLELRLRTPFEAKRPKEQKGSMYGLEPIEVGIKAELYQTKDTSVGLSLYSTLGLPHVASKEHEADKAFYTARLLLQNKLTDKIKINYNIGRDWDREDMQQTWMYSISPQIELSDKWLVFLEEYGDFIPKEEPEHYVDAGLAYIITNNLEIDINAGKGLNKKSSSYFLTAGISFRL